MIACDRTVWSSISTRYSLSIYERCDGIDPGVGELSSSNNKGASAPFFVC